MDTETQHGIYNNKIDIDEHETGWTRSNLGEIVWEFENNGTAQN